MSRKKSTATRRAESQAAAERAAAIRQEQERSERRRRVVVIVAVLVVVAVLGTILVAYFNGSGSDKPSTAPQGAVASYAVPAGPSSAPVKVKVYEDFLCPFCGQFEAGTRDALQKQVDAGKVQVQYHVLNFLGSSSGDYSSRAANALAVVLDTSGPEVAKKFHDLLFENQPEEGTDGLSDARLIEYAVQAGATKADVEPGIKDRTFEAWVDAGTEQASKDKVNATPTVKVDGKTLESTSIDGLVSELEKAVEAGS